MAESECAICLDNFLEGEDITCLPCAHRYHAECINEHAFVHGVDIMDIRCPKCRKTPSEVQTEAQTLLEASPAALPGTPETIVASEPASPAGDGAPQPAGVDDVIDAVPPASPLGVINVADIATDVPATQQEPRDREGVPQQDAIALGGAVPQQDAQPLPPQQDAEPLPPQQDAEPLPPQPDAEPLSPQQDAPPLPPQQDAEPLAPQQDAQPLLLERATVDDDMPLAQVAQAIAPKGSLLSMIRSRSKSANIDGQLATAQPRRRAKSSPAVTSKGPPTAKANVAGPPPPPPQTAAALPADAGAQAKGKRAAVPAKGAPAAKKAKVAAKAPVINVAKNANVGLPPNLVKAAGAVQPSLSSDAGPPPPPPKHAATVRTADADGQAKGNRAAGPANDAPPAKKAHGAKATTPVNNVEVPLRPDRSEALGSMVGSSIDHLVDVYNDVYHELVDTSDELVDVNAESANNKRQRALLDPSLCQCELCGSIVEMGRARIRSKKQGTFNCVKCCSTVTKLYRETGGVPKLDSLSEAQINEFYTRAQKCFTTLELQSLKMEFSVTHEAHRAIYYDNQGKFLPLSVWKNMGYDVDRIKNFSNPHDVRSDPVLGEVYRVVTMVTGDRGHESTVVSESWNAKGSGKGPKAGPEQILALTQALKNAKTIQKDDAADAKKKEKVLKACNTCEVKIKNILAMNPGAFSESVLESVQSLLASMPALVDADAKDAYMII